MAHKDLFQFYELMPPELSKIIDRYSKKLERGISYKQLTELHAEVNKIGFTFDAGLDAEPFTLRPIGVELNQVEGYECF